ncbi:MAG: hypothetical protein P8X46_07060 [Nitrospirales bacterium]
MARSAAAVSVVKYGFPVPAAKIGVLVEVNCETDFVARNEEFQAFVKEVALQIAASHPLSISTSRVRTSAISSARFSRTEG